MKGFQVMGQTSSNIPVKFENRGKKMLISIKLTNYDEENALLFYSKPLINASLNIKLILESDDADKEAYFIRLKKPSFYLQPGAIDKGILFWLNYKDTYDHCNVQCGAFTTTTI